MIQPLQPRPAALLCAGFLLAGFLVAVVTAPLWSQHRLAAGAAASLTAIGVFALCRRSDRVRHGSAPEPAAPGEPVLDLAALAALEAIGDQAFVREVARQFEVEARLVMLRIASAVGNRDPADFAAQTHALRSSAANVGARRLYALCLQGRDLQADELAADGPARVAALQRELDAACDALRAATPLVPPAGPRMAKAAAAH